MTNPFHINDPEISYRLRENFRASAPRAIAFLATVCAAVALLRML